MDKQEQELQEKTIVDAISDYAKAYENLEFIQRLGEEKKGDTPILIPIGDQKTGAIGEYLGLKIIKNLLKNIKLKFQIFILKRNLNQI